MKSENAGSLEFVQVLVKIVEIVKIKIQRVYNFKEYTSQAFNIRNEYINVFNFSNIIKRGYIYHQKLPNPRSN